MRRDRFALPPSHSRLVLAFVGLLGLAACPGRPEYLKAEKYAAESAAAGDFEGAAGDWAYAASSAPTGSWRHSSALLRQATYLAAAGRRDDALAILQECITTADDTDYKSFCTRDRAAFAQGRMPSRAELIREAELEHAHQTERAAATDAVMQEFMLQQVTRPIIPLPGTGQSAVPWGPPANYQAKNTSPNSQARYGLSPDELQAASQHETCTARYHACAGRCSQTYEVAAGQEVGPQYVPCLQQCGDLSDCFSGSAAHRSTDR